MPTPRGRATSQARGRREGTRPENVKPGAATLTVDLWSSPFAVALVAAFVASTVRGFSGFGAAMILVPVLAALYGPRIAVPVIVMVDFVLTMPVVVRAVKDCAWTEILPLVVGYALALPLGIYVLLVADPWWLTQAMAVLVLLVALAMALGVRRRTAPGRAATVATGGVAGLLAGSTGIGGPPVVLFWLSGQDAAVRTRANIYVFFAMTGVIGLLSFGGAGVLTVDALLLSVALAPAYALGLLLGAKAFGRADDALYRRVALAVIATVGISTLALG